MSQWPHAPHHLFDPGRTYMITGSTLQKEHFFKTPAELTLLEDHLFELALKYQWSLEAWALFSNHYHIIARAPDILGSLKKFITHLHANTARELNKLHNQPGRTVWYQYRDTQLSYQKSYMARLNYVMQNPVKHGIIDLAENYPWCSAHWFTRNASSSYKKVVMGYKTDDVQVEDDY